jgi:hypothetical protein
LGSFDFFRFFGGFCTSLCILCAASCVGETHCGVLEVVVWDFFGGEHQGVFSIFKTELSLFVKSF